MSKMNKYVLTTRTILVVWAIAVLANYSMAQEHTAEKWTLKQCVDYALDNNLSVQRSLLNMQSNNVDYDQSKMSLLPSVNASGGTGYNWGRSINPNTNQFVTERIQSANASLNASMTLYNGSALRNAIKQNKLAFEASKNDLEKSKNDITQNVILFYMNVIFNKELLKNAKLQLESSDQQLRRAEKQEEEGAIAKSSLYELMAQRATNEVNVTNQQNQLNLSVLQLKQLLQISGTEDFDIVHPEIDIDKVMVDVPGSVDEIYNISEDYMPEIKRTDLNVQSADYGLKSARGNYLPRISANLNINSNYSSFADQFIRDGSFSPVLISDPENPSSQIPAYRQIKYSAVHGNDFYIAEQTPNGTFESKSFSDQFSDNLRRSAGISISIPIFNGYQTRANVQRALIRKKQAEINAIETRNTLRQTIETAHNDVLAAAKSYSASLRQVQANEEAYRIAKQRHELNAISNIDYQIAENNQFQAKSDLLRAKYDYIFKLKILDFYQGKNLDF